MKIVFAKQGDTLAGLAKKYGVPLAETGAANPGLDPFARLNAGTKIKIPAKQQPPSAQTEHPFLQDPPPAFEVASVYDWPVPASGQPDSGNSEQPPYWMEGQVPVWNGPSYTPEPPPWFDFPPFDRFDLQHAEFPQMPEFPEYPEFPDLTGSFQQQETDRDGAAEEQEEKADAEEQRETSGGKKTVRKPKRTKPGTSAITKIRKLSGKRPSAPRRKPSRPWINEISL